MAMATSENYLYPCQGCERAFSREEMTRDSAGVLFCRDCMEMYCAKCGGNIRVGQMDSDRYECLDCGWEMTGS